jgi:hypothetical protein
MFGLIRERRIFYSIWYEVDSSDKRKFDIQNDTSYFTLFKMSFIGSQRFYVLQLFMWLIQSVASF